MATQTYQHGTLTLEREENDTVHIRWLGQSIDRDPGRFILPILTDALEEIEESDRRLVLDFREMSYMNSSTITPIIRVLERVKRGTNSVTILYRKELSWQKLSFTALEIFQTSDQRISICGA